MIFSRRGVGAGAAGAAAGARTRLPRAWGLLLAVAFASLVSWEAGPFFARVLSAIGLACWWASRTPFRAEVVPGVERIREEHTSAQRQSVMPDLPCKAWWARSAMRVLDGCNHRSNGFRAPRLSDGAALPFPAARVQARRVRARVTCTTARRARIVPAVRAAASSLHYHLAWAIVGPTLALLPAFGSLQRLTNLYFFWYVVRVARPWRDRTASFFGCRALAIAAVIGSSLLVPTPRRALAVVRALFAVLGVIDGGETGATMPPNPPRVSVRWSPMEIILAIDENLGKPGDIVKVSPGYARNYLLPRGLAYEATPGNRKRIAMEKARLEAAEAERIKAAQSLAERLESVQLTFSARVGEEEKLFGSVTTATSGPSARGPGVRHRENRSTCRADQVPRVTRSRSACTPSEAGDQGVGD